MNQHGVWVPLPFDVPHGPVTGTVGDDDLCAGGVDVVAGRRPPISNLEGRVAERLSERVADRPRPCLTKLHDQIGHGGNRSPLGTHAKADRDRADHGFVYPQCGEHRFAAGDREPGGTTNDERGGQRQSSLQRHCPVVPRTARRR